MAENGRITPQDLGLTSASAEFMGQSLGKAREAVERQMIEGALTRNKGNISRAAIELEISRPEPVRTNAEAGNSETVSSGGN
jgi:transcriptional regulator with PAS, ATPase and Fis domain